MFLNSRCAQQAVADSLVDHDRFHDTATDRFPRNASSPILSTRSRGSDAASRPRSSNNHPRIARPAPPVRSSGQGSSLSPPSIMTDSSSLPKPASVRSRASNAFPIDLISSCDRNRTRAHLALRARRRVQQQERSLKPPRHGSVSHGSDPEVPTGLTRHEKNQPGAANPKGFVSIS